VLWDRCSVGGTATIKEATLAELEVRNPDEADEVRPFVDKGRVDIVNLAGGFVGRGVFEPGWRWSEHVKPIAGTDSCQSSHLAY
jgi:hypothetical protein